MTQKLLTIAIPTYNRYLHLRVLLQVLQVELAGLKDMVDVVVSDNASTDKTPDITASFITSIPSMRIIRNASNIGPDSNFGQCVIEARSKYVWIIGDDDVPKTGVIRQVASLLNRETPDMIYMQSEWIDEVTSDTQGGLVKDLKYSVLGKSAFASRVHVWFTFISGVIINKSVLLDTAGESVIRSYVGTNFVQLGWVLNLLKFGNRFIYVSDCCVLATSNNTGGYSVITTFGSNYPRIVSDVFGHDSALANILISRNLACYLPSLIWQVRFSSIGNFRVEDPWPALQNELGRYLYFWLFVMPIGRFPKYIAWPFFQTSRVIAKLVKIYDRVKSFFSTRPI